MRHLSIFGGRKRPSSRKSIFGGYRKPNFRKSIFGGHKKPNSHKSIFGGRKKTNPRKSISESRKRPNPHKSIFEGHRRPNFRKNGTSSAKRTFTEGIDFTHMTSFHTPITKALVIISVIWFAFVLLFYVATFLDSNTSKDSGALFSVTGFVVTFSLCGSPAWLLLYIVGFLLKLEKTRTEKSQNMLSAIQNNSTYAKQDGEINGNSIEFLRLQAAKNIHPDFEDIALIPEMTVDNTTADKTRSKAGQVYLIQSDRGYYKIGMTKNIDDRMATFYVKLPFEPDLIHVIECEDRRAMEKSLHIKFAAKRINGEWFDLTGTDVAFIKSIKKV